MIRAAFVDVWIGSLALDRPALAGCYGMLSAEERAKAESFKLNRVRDRYAASRFYLRQTLADYLGCSAHGLRFTLGPYGKPSLACGSLFFNISHTGEMLSIAVTDVSEVGIDIEAVKPRANLTCLAQRCFSPAEYAHWQALPAAEHSASFYRLWTKKEAYVKAIGRGIGFGLENCEFDPAEHGQITALPPGCGDRDAWRIVELDVGVDHYAALAVANADFKLSIKSLPAPDSGLNA
ncbi:4'-phosphopantetheinyl transferase superfamily protein [Methylomonas sp. HYX-M1]|uniref:4'-phosphopantetheinyl transferase family protein n=1 Tax=Methylomonas sp. HYX-M1 TaxID=3139307 RepID=UPI00345BDAFC